MIKIDSTGAIQWQKYIDSPWHNKPYALFPVSTGYFMVGHCALGGTLGYGTMVLKTDFNGNPIFGKMYQNIIPFSSADIVTDSEIFITATKQRGPTVAGQFNYDLVSFKTDSLGNLLFAKKHLTNQLGIYSSSLIRAGDGGYFIAANSTIDPTYNTYNGFFAKTDSLGNSCSDSTLSINVVDITSMIVTSDTITPVVSSYPVAVGRSPFDYYARGINIMDFCNGNVGINENLDVEDGMILFPNPAEETVNIETGLKEYTVCLFDTFGKLHFKQKVSQNKIQINLSGLSDGLYFIQLQSEDRVISRKFIKQ
jgi:hypothetical protein